MLFSVWFWYLYLHTKYVGFLPLKLLIKGSSSLIITFRVFDWCCVAHFTVSQIRCSKKIDLWVRTIPGNTSNFLGGMNERVGNVENALMAKCIKVITERINAEGQIATKIQRVRYMSRRDMGRNQHDLKIENDLARASRLVVLGTLFWRGQGFRKRQTRTI